MSSLNFRLIARDGGSVELADFSDFMEKLNDVLRIVYRSTNAGSGAPPKYEIYRLEVGSACCGVQSSGSGGMCIDSFVATTEAIRSKTIPPIRLTSADARNFKKLADTLSKNVASILLNEELPIDSQFVLGCEWLIESSPKSYGEAIGRLESLNLHNAKKFRIYPVGVDRGAECFFPDEMQDRVLSLVTKRVRVSGLIHRDPDGVGIDRITEVRSIDPLLEDTQLPKLRDLIGLFAECPVNIAAGWED